MKSYTREFKQKIEKAKNILILTHRSPDIDAFCSMIMMKRFLNKYFPNKEVSMKARQMPGIALPRMKEITLSKIIINNSEDLIIVTDAGTLDQCLDETVDTFSKDLTKTIFVDHHAETNPEVGSFTINEERSSASEQVYATFRDMFGRRFKIDKDIAELAQYGIVADTGRFLYSTTTPDSLRIFADAKEVSNADLEEMAYKVSKFPKEANDAMIAYMKTLTIQKDMAYMYMTKEMINENNLVKTGINEAQNFLRDKYIRFIQGVHWGFILKPDFDHEDLWFVSFRSTKGYQEVGNIAQKLGGGGHAYASASPITAKTGEEALKKVLDAISEVISI